MISNEVVYAKGIPARASAASRASNTTMLLTRTMNHERDIRQISLRLPLLCQSGRASNFPDRIRSFGKVTFFLQHLDYFIQILDPLEKDNNN